MKSDGFEDVASSAKSLPSRGRGLKFPWKKKTAPWGTVAPLAGAWVEITLIPNEACINAVAPLAGAWVEIMPEFKHKED